MVLRVWISLLFLVAGIQGASLANSAPPLYHQIAGGEETVTVAKRTGVTELALARGVRWTVVVGQNHLKKPYKINAGRSVKINSTHIVPTELRDGLVINLPELNLYYFQNGVYQRRYALAVGKPSWPTPTGSYKIYEKRKNPIWNVPPSIQEEMEMQGQRVVQKVAPGPKNPLGKFWMGTTASGVGIHATNRPWSVGYSVSHGCIRMLPQEIEQLFAQIEVGTPVKIVYWPIKLALTPQGRVYLEANLNIYQWELHALDWVKDMAAYYRIQDRIDWSKVPPILRKREGIAQDITKDPPSPAPAVTPGLQAPTEVRLSPLQGGATKLE